MPNGVKVPMSGDLNMKRESNNFFKCGVCTSHAIMKASKYGCVEVEHRINVSIFVYICHITVAISLCPKMISYFINIQYYGISAILFQ